MLEDSVNRLFDQLEAFQDFPWFSVGSRVDSMIGMYLPEYLSNRPIADRTFSDVKLVAQGFPFRTNRVNHHAARADFLFQHSQGWILGKLKTDSSSYQPEELSPFSSISNDPREAQALIRGLHDIGTVSRAWGKYHALLKAAEQHRWAGPVDVLYLAHELLPESERRRYPKVLCLRLREVFAEWTPREPDLLFLRLQRLLAL